MKIKDGFMLREIAGQWIVVPLGERVVEFNCIISINDTGAFIWRLMEQGIREEQIIQAILKEYNVDEDTARNDLCEFIDLIKDNDLAIV